MTIPCPYCADGPDALPGEIHRGGGVYSLCPNCDGDGYVSKKADVSPGTNPQRKPSEACEKPCDDAVEKLCGGQEGFVKTRQGDVRRNPIEELYEELQALKERVEKLEAGEFGR